MPEPVPDTARTYVKTVADLYGEAVLAILRIIAERAGNGLDDAAPRAKAADLLALRAQAQAIAAQLGTSLDTTLAAVLGAAFDHGVDQAAEHVAEVIGLRDADEDRAARRGLVATKRTTVEALARSLAGQLTALPIVRGVEDAYQRAIVSAALPSAAGVEARRAATQRALDRLATEGVGGFVDKSGRRWQLDTYAEMATRTVVQQAAVEGSVSRIQAATPFVRIAESSDECDRCRPWEGAVLLTVAPSAIPEKWRDVPYDGTLRQATGAGLFHPNCTHAVGAFIPGLTRTRAERPTTPNPQGYADRQEQRRLERQVREWKRREAVALDPAARARAQGKVQHYQQRIAEHVAATSRPRRRDREQLRLPRA